MNYQYYSKKFQECKTQEETREVMLEAFHDEEITPKEYGKLGNAYFRNKPQPRSYELRDNKG